MFKELKKKKESLLVVYDSKVFFLGEVRYYLYCEVFIVVIKIILGKFFKYIFNIYFWMKIKNDLCGFEIFIVFILLVGILMRFL